MVPPFFWTRFIVCHITVHVQQTQLLLIADLHRQTDMISSDSVVDGASN